MLSLAKEDQYYQIILAQGVGMGIGVGLCYVPALVTAALHFPGRQAIAMVCTISTLTSVSLKERIFCRESLFPLDRSEEVFSPVSPTPANGISKTHRNSQL